MASDESMDVMVAALDRQRRIGWARAYAAEEKLTEAAATIEETTRELARLREAEKLYRYTNSALKIVAPSLSPWLNGPGAGLSAFDGQGVCSTDDAAELREAGKRDAIRWRAMDDATRQRRDWRATQLMNWYDDPDASLPSCADCGDASWDHAGPDDPCTKCQCAAFVAPAAQ